SIMPPPPSAPLFPYTTLFRSGDRFAGQAQPPAFPLTWGLWWLVWGEQVVSAERTAPVLLGEQAQVVAVERGFDPPPSGGPVVGRSEEHTSELQSLTNLVCRLL